MPVSDAVRVRHILEAAQEAVAFVRGRSRGDLDTDRMLGLALVRLLEIIGEAARGVSATLREAHPEVAWSRMSGMRDRLVHGYFDVNMDVVWETVAQDLPLLIDRIGNIVASGSR
jgi:uncharacterized protein with HEPN domain